MRIVYYEFSKKKKKQASDCFNYHFCLKLLQNTNFVLNVALSHYLIPSSIRLLNSCYKLEYFEKSVSFLLNRSLTVSLQFSAFCH